MEGMPYDFQYVVQDPESSNTYSHVENSNGKTTQGQYRVLLPDGRTQSLSLLTYYLTSDECCHIDTSTRTLDISNLEFISVVVKSFLFHLCYETRRLPFSTTTVPSGGMEGCV
ncbi:Pro-resilin [Portunus trituberculatus]|uniref:Pro-resilin n=1 Tax=Portunus trituberculatus TaxID=210409 RepID=A0A5B7G603_PORTR|nr:Pro-resilin [Portunus trituberculatus]